MSGAVGRLDYDRSKGTFRGWLFTVTRNAYEHLPGGPERVAAGEWRSGRAGMAGGQASRDESRPPGTASTSKRLLAYAAEQVRPSFEDAPGRPSGRRPSRESPARRSRAGLGMTVGAVYIAKSRVLSRIKDEVPQLLDE